MKLCHCQEWHCSNAVFNPILVFMGLKMYLIASQETTKPHQLIQNSFMCHKRKKPRQKVTSMNFLLIDRHTPALHFPISNTHVRFGSRIQTNTMLWVLIKQTLKMCPKRSATRQLFWHGECKHKTTGKALEMILSLWKQSEAVSQQTS